MKKTFSRWGKKLLVTAAFLSIFCVQLTYAQNISFDFNRKPLKEVLAEITRQSGYNFVYSEKNIQLNTLITAKYNGKIEPISALLEKVFNGTGIVCKINGKQVALTMKTQSEPSQKTSLLIKGALRDNLGEPLPGVFVKNKNTGAYAVSDIDGNYEIKATKGDVLLFTLVGMQDYTASVGNSTKMNISMEVDIETLEDVVVTGYQTISKERSAGSYAVLSSKDLEAKVQTNVLERMEGMVAGLSLYKGTPVIRGTATINADKDPLYVLDGVPFEGNLDDINPDDIANISVLKDATAASIYGARSTNGVIVITTKSGSSGKISVSYSGTATVTPLPGRSYANLMSSSEFVDYQEFLFNKLVGASATLDEGYYINPVYKLMFDRRDGVISDEAYNTAINKYKGYDRYDQVKDELLNSAEVVHQHNFSVRGGSDFYKYSLSLNYKGTSPYNKGQYTDRIGINVKNTFNLAKWVSVDLGIMANDSQYEYFNGTSGISMLNNGEASYMMLRDESGNPVEWGYEKDAAEIARLKGIGLFDETYYPVNEKDNQKQAYKNQYVNVNIGARFNIIEGLNAEIRYQTERTNQYSKTYWSKESYIVKNMINNAAQISSSGTTTYNIPTGGQVREANLSKKSYTLRAQVNYSKLFNEEHDVKVLVGAERRKITAEQNGHYRYGYDDDNLSYKTINEKELRSGIRNTESLTGRYQIYSSTDPAYLSSDDRYISFYGNASYLFRNRIGVNASIRMDQSNLFGTDPKYQYRPLWSIGANYVAIEQNNTSWLNRLNVRSTYGINGNVYKNSGPYILAKVSSWSNWYTNETYGVITSPPNSGLRWEKTHTFNIGVDFQTLGSRLNGSIEAYNKKTTDMIGARASDPTYGWTSLVVNYASMRNTGVELSLNSTNISNGKFEWTTDLMFSYNNNKILTLENSGTTAYSYLSGLDVREGKAYRSLYSVRYAGLDENGKPTAYNKNGEVVTTLNSLNPDDLVYSGTYDPPYSASLSNSFRYKGFSLSFMFVYYGGHVLRDVTAKWNSYVRSSQPYYDSYYTTNGDKLFLNMWKQAGDEMKGGEKNLEILPAPGYNISNSIAYLWYAADTNTQKGDYVKLRDLSLSYSFPQSMLSRCKLQGITLTFSAQNLWYWAANRHNLDPESWYSSTLGYANRGSVVPASYTFGIRINY